VAKALGGESQSGDWTIRRSDVPGKVEFSLMDSRAGHHFHTSSDWRRAIFPAWIFPRPGGRKFILRSRGTQENSNARDFCTTARARTIHFSATEVSAGMKSLGFERIDGDKQWAMAIHDVSLNSRRTSKPNLQGLDTEN